jgi:hypothetical protein
MSTSVSAIMQVSVIMSVDYYIYKELIIIIFVYC